MRPRVDQGIGCRRSPAAPWSWRGPGITTLEARVAGDLLLRLCPHGNQSTLTRSPTVGEHERPSGIKVCLWDKG